MKLARIALAALMLSVIAAGSAAAQAQKPKQECLPFPADRGFDPDHPPTSYTRPMLEKYPTPIFPASLGKSTREGVVVLAFVVGCDGKVDSSSVKVVSATDSAFIPPARHSVIKSEYRAAVLEGKKVSVLVQQSIHLLR